MQFALFLIAQSIIQMHGTAEASAAIDYHDYQK